jgi:hypothetical protein
LFKVSYRIAKYKKPHLTGESSVLPAAIPIAETMLDESYTKELQITPFADNTVRRRTLDISEDLCNQPTDQLKTPHFVFQIDEATNVVKDAHLITYVWFEI